MSRNISLTEKKQIALIQNGNHDEIMKFIKTNQSFRFAPSVAQIFVERGNSEEIMAYIAMRPLAERGELALIKRGMHQEILAYVKGHKLYEDAEKALIHRGEYQEIEKAAKRCAFGFSGELELINFGVHRHIMAYIKIRKFNNCAALNAFFKRKNMDEIELYKSLYGVN